MVDTNIPRKILPYTSHGVEINGKSGSVHRTGNCPFCEKENHFFVNEEDGRFKCHVCGESGNIISWLDQCTERYCNDVSRVNWLQIVKQRNIPAETLKRFHVGYDTDGKRFTIPSRGPSGRVQNILTWRLGGSLLTTGGCEKQLFNVDRMVKAPKTHTIWVCEGEWDCMALDWLIRKAKIKATAVAVPGAGIFKKQWVSHFHGYDVVLCYDRDVAGDKGIERAGNTLQGVAKSLRFVEWPIGKPEGWDLRDMISSVREIGTNVNRAFKRLEAYAKVWVPEQVEGTSSIPVEEKLPPVDPADVPSFPEVAEVYERWIDMNDDLRLAMKIIFATIFSIQHPGINVWIYFIGPSSSGKTMLLDTCQNSESTFFRSQVSPKALCSGMKDNKDPSLLPRVNGKCFVWKDFTEMLDQYPTERDEVFGVLRGAFDGRVERSWGNGIERIYKDLHFSMIAGVTPQIHLYPQAMMGERFLKYQILKDINHRSMANVIKFAILRNDKQKERNDELCDFARRFLAKKTPEKAEDWPRFSGKFVDRIAALAELIGRLRATVAREQYGDKNVKARPYCEAGTRLGQQLISMCQCLAFVEGKKRCDDEESWAQIERIAFDTAIGFNLDVMQVVLESKVPMSRKDIEVAVDLPGTSLSDIIQNMLLINLLVRSKKKINDAGRTTVYYEPSKLAKTLWKTARVSRKQIGLPDELKGLRVRRPRRKVSKATARRA